jgi:pyrroloquinoline quinone (PQQ) biosynthesis protein C
MTPLQAQYRVRRVYGTSKEPSGSVSMRLSDQTVELGAKEHGWFESVSAWLPTTRGVADLGRELGMDEAKIPKFLEALERAGLLYRVGVGVGGAADAASKTISGVEFHARFSKILASWLDEAFAHPFWERMMSGKGSKRLFTGWLIELYHYTKNANRHMPLSCATAREKAIKQLRAKHYAEEWNHYHYFMKALKALGFTEPQIANSVPLPMTLALSNFMRQAAREDVLAYSICSAVLEGTTVDRKTYNPYYEKAAELYDVPRGAIQPIYAHLDLDVQYQHSDLFLDILKTVESMSSERASTVLSYGHQLVEHIWMWTDNIERYYDVAGNPMPRQSFDAALD